MLTVSTGCRCRAFSGYHFTISNWFPVRCTHAKQQREMKSCVMFRLTLTVNVNVNVVCCWYPASYRSARIQGHFLFSLKRCRGVTGDKRFSGNSCVAERMESFKMNIKSDVSMFLKYSMLLHLSQFFILNMTCCS